MHAYMFMCVCVCIYVSTFVGMYVAFECMYVCMHVNVCAYISVTWPLNTGEGAKSTMGIRNFTN